VGRQPNAVAANWKTGRAYVVNSGEFTAALAGSVSVLAPCRT
jgi:DNA-binding beta-propeller fold protein YncE